MEEYEFADWLAEVLRDCGPDKGDPTRFTVKSFRDAGLRYNEGLVIRSHEGDEFQLTIVRSRVAPTPEPTP